MGRAFLLVVSCLLISCTQRLLGDDPSGSAEETFEGFWRGVDMTWPEFATKNIDWDSVYAVYRPKVHAGTTDAALRDVFQELILALRDTHTTIYPNGYADIRYYPAFRSNFYGLPWITTYYLKNAKGNRALMYGLLTPEIGYVYIATFSNDPSDYLIIDNVLASFGAVKGIVIDVRRNTGGESYNGEIVASRFADKQRTYSYTRFRTNDNRYEMSGFLAANIAPDSPTPFRGKVAVLSNRYSYSATEDFILMMKSLPNTIQLGDNTGGGSGTRPILKELPNGWTYRVSSKLLCDLNREPISKGIAPNIIVHTTKADSVAGKDAVIERAILELLK